MVQILSGAAPNGGGHTEGALIDDRASSVNAAYALHIRLDD